MDIERKQRWQKIRLIITEIIMVLAVVVTAGVLFAIVTGWRVNEDFSIEQYGQLDIRSYPTGASIMIDGETQAFASTNTSRMLTEGTHRVKLEKEGYDSWEKEVSVIPGWAVRLRYPRLFRQERKTEVVKEVGELGFLTMAPNRDSILYSKKDAKVWSWMSVRGNDSKVTEVDLTKILDGNIVNMKWAWGSERVLLALDSGKWVVVNLAQPKESVSLGKYDKVVFGDGAGSKVWVLKEGILYMMRVGADTGAKKMLEGVEDFMADENEIVYLTKADAGKQKIGLYHEGDDGGVVIREIEAGVKVKLMASSYAGERFVGATEDSEFRVYRMDNYPVFGGEFEIPKEIKTEMGWVPEGEPVVSYNGEFFVLRKGEEVVVFDAELAEYSKYSYPGKETWWLDDYMLSDVEDGALVVRDFDGTNVRTLVKSNVTNEPAMVTANNKWLYYVADGKIVREQVN